MRDADLDSRGLASSERIFTDFFDLSEHSLNGPQNKPVCILVENNHGKSKHKSDEKGPDQVQNRIELWIPCDVKHRYTDEAIPIVLQETLDSAFKIVP